MCGQLQSSDGECPADRVQSVGGLVVGDLHGRITRLQAGELCTEDGDLGVGVGVKVGGAGGRHVVHVGGCAGIGGGGGESVGSPPAFPSRSRPLSGAERLAELAAGLDEIGLARSSARSSRPISATPQAPPSEAGGSEADGPGLVGGACGGGQLDSGGLASSIAFGRLGGSLDVRGEGTSVGTSFAGLSESLGWLKSDSHQDRLRRLREKYGYDQ